MGPKLWDLKGMKSISSVVDLFLLYLLTTCHLITFAPSSSHSKISTAEPMLESKPATGVIQCFPLIPSSLISPTLFKGQQNNPRDPRDTFPTSKRTRILHKDQPRIHEPALLPQPPTTSKAAHSWEYPGELIGLIISLTFLAITGGVRGSYQTQLYLITSSLPPSSDILSWRCFTVSQILYRPNRSRQTTSLSEWLADNHRHCFCQVFWIEKPSSASLHPSIPLPKPTNHVNVRDGWKTKSS